MKLSTTLTRRLGEETLNRNCHSKLNHTKQNNTKVGRNKRKGRHEQNYSSSSPWSQSARSTTGGGHASPNLQFLCTSQQGANERKHRNSNACKKYEVPKASNRLNLAAMGGSTSIFSSSFGTLLGPHEKLSTIPLFPARICIYGRVVTPSLQRDVGSMRPYKLHLYP